MSRMVDVAGVQFGGNEVILIAGPCAVESEEQVFAVAQAVKASGARMLRGGAFKPRTSPRSFQGLGERGLELLAHARERTGLPVVTEVLDVRRLELVSTYADMLQIGSRNMQNFPLLQEVGRTRLPVLFKRGMSATLSEYLQAVEYIRQGGNEQIVLCERGIRTFEPWTRSTLDLNAVPLLKQESDLPVIVDPSHGTGHSWLVPPMSLAAIAAGADGLLIEVHDQPEHALSDGPQSLTPEQFNTLAEGARAVARAVGRYCAEEAAVCS